jgi:hypothetical protein
LLVMAALIPRAQLTDCWGRKRRFTVGLVVYGIGALLSAVAPVLASSSWQHDRGRRQQHGGDEDRRPRSRTKGKTAKARKARG